MKIGRIWMMAVSALSGSLAVGETLTWNGGASGAWSATEANWVKEDRTPTAWIDGSVARFSDAASVTVSDATTLGGLVLNGGTLTVEGNPLTFADGAKIQYVRTTGGVRFDNAVTAAGALSQEFSGEGGLTFALDADVYLSAEKEANGDAVKRRILPRGVTLEALQQLKVSAEFKKSSSAWVAFPATAAEAITYPAHSGNDTPLGIHNWMYDAGSKSATCQIKIGNSFWYPNMVTCVKIRLTEEEDGVYAQVVYVKTAISGQQGEAKNLTDIDFDPFTPTQQGTLVGAGANGQKNSVRIHDFSATLSTAVLSGLTTELAGDVTLRKPLTINAGAFKLLGPLNPDGLYNQKITIAEGGCLAFGASASQNLGSQVVGKGRLEVLPGSAVVYPAGSAIAVKNLTIEPAIVVSGTLTLAGEESGGNGASRNALKGSRGLTVRSGGVLNLGKGDWYDGHDGATIVCLPGGTVCYTQAFARGKKDNSITVDGGRLDLCDYASDLEHNNAGKLMMLKNGATVTGAVMTWAWSETENRLVVSGTSPSRIANRRIRFGQFGKTASESLPNMVEQIEVADVTGDAAADLTVSAQLYLNPRTTWARANEAWCGMEKTGEGTMLLTAAGSELAGSLKVKAGTVAFGPEASLSGMSLWLQGGAVDVGSSTGSVFHFLKVTDDSTLALASGGSVTFVDSSACAWTAGATLTVTGALTRRSVRIGESDAALTAQQLAAIRFRTPNGRLAPMTLDARGYLLPPPTGFSLIVR